MSTINRELKRRGEAIDERYSEKRCERLSFQEGDGACGTDNTTLRTVMDQPCNQNDCDESTKLLPNHSSTEVVCIKSLFNDLNRKMSTQFSDMKCLILENISAVNSRLLQMEKRMENVEARIKIHHSSFKKFSSVSSVSPITNATESIVLLDLPVNNLSELQAFDFRLMDPMFAIEFKNSLLRIRQYDLKHFVYEAMQTIFSRKFGNVMNFKGTGGKFGFSHTKTWKVIQVAISERTDFPQLSQTFLNKMFSDWIKGMRDRGRSRVRNTCPKKNPRRTSSLPEAAIPELKLKVSDSPI